jgi:O-antigen/teichoic acid export membrane protein
VTLTSAASIPLVYYRNWILGQIGETAEVVGTFAVILLFSQIVITFVLFGDSSVLTNFLPKIERGDDKSDFLFTYGLISLVGAAAFVILMNLFPSLISFLIHKPVDMMTLRALSFLAPIIVLSQVVIFSLAGLMQFGLSSVLSQTQLSFVCIMATTAFFFFPLYLQEHAVLIFAVTVGVANLAVISIGTTHVLRSISCFIPRLRLPAGFWKFSVFGHLNSFTMFAYQSIDQIFVLTTLGTKELGGYFVLWQCAQLIVFVPARISKVMLASFSHLVGNGNHNDLPRVYLKLCRIMLILSTPLALLMILFSQPIARIFGDWSAERHLYLLLLASALQIGSIGTVNSMLILSKERTGMFLATNCVQIVLQLVITFNFIDDYGVYAVILGKAAGIASAQVGLFLIVRWKLDGIWLPPPNDYWISLIVVLGTAAVSILRSPLPLLWAIPIFIFSLGCFLYLIRFRVEEFTQLLSVR